MSFDPPRKINPFEAPRAGIGERIPDLDLGDDGGAEATRRAYLGHEASVKALGSLQYLGAFFCVFGMLFFFAAAAGLVDMNAGRQGMTPEQMRIFNAVAGGAFVAGFAIYAGLGYGLRSLQPWARWVMIVLTSLSLLATAAQVVFLAAVNPAAAAGGLVGAVIPSLITGYILYLVASAKGAMVFSGEYKDVIRKTPGIKYKTSIIVKIFLGLLIFVIVLGVVALIFSPRR